MFVILAIHMRSSNVYVMLVVNKHKSKENGTFCYENKRKFYRQYTFVMLTNWGWVTHICVSKLIIIGSDSGLAPSLYLNQRWNIVNSNLKNKLLWNSYIFIHENAFEMSSGKWRPFCLTLNVLISVCNWVKKHINLLWPCGDIKLGQHKLD